MEAGAKAEAEANKREKTADFIMVRLENTEDVTTALLLHKALRSLLLSRLHLVVWIAIAEVQPDEANVTKMISFV